MDNIKYHIEKVQEYLVTERKVHEAEIARLKELATVSTLVTSFEKVPAFGLRHNIATPRFFSERLQLLGASSGIFTSSDVILDVELDEAGVEAAKAKIEELFARDMPIHKENLAKHQANEAAIAKAVAYLKAMGVPESVSVYNSRKRRSESVRNPVFHSLYESMPKYAQASFNFEYAKRELIMAIERKLQESKRLKAEKAAQQKAARLSDPLLPEAVEFLALRGKKAGVDYTMEDAVETANEIAYTEAVKHKQEANEMWEFSGEDSCENCGGWDGISHRCECGNRRVSWVRQSDFSFKNPILWAEAH